MSYYSQGLKTFKVPMKLHQINRLKLLEQFQKKNSKNIENSIILLKGGESCLRYDTDHEPIFRQESYFHYLFGVKEPDCWGALDINSKKSFLFIPKLPSEYSIWMGKIQSPSYFKEKYEVDEVRYVEDLDSVLSEELKAKTLYLLHGKNTDSGNYSKIPHFAGIEKYKIDKEKLHPILSECRVIKSSLEIDLLKYVNKIASEAHKEVMRRIKPGMMEYQMEAIFCYECYYNGGCRHVSYTCICASGENASILHYGHSGLPNSKKINEGEMVMFDMGCEYHCYASDISRSFPVSGKFTLEQKQIYESVLAAQEAVMKAMKPGVSWVDMHKLSNRVICEELKKYGFLKGDIDEMMKHHIGAIFMPHGLGHFMGIDTHDVGGYNGNYERINEQPGLKNIRTVRVLEPGMVLTVEPGIYFIDSLLDKALADPIQSQFLVKEKIQQFRNFGGVRIEDDVIVTENGIENMTTAPRTVEEIEKWMSNKDSN